MKEGAVYPSQKIVFLICVSCLTWAILLREEKLEELLQILQGYKILQDTISGIDKVPEKHKKELSSYCQQLYQASHQSSPQQYYMEEFFLLYKEFS